MFWLSDGGYLLTAVPPMGDVRGSGSWMTIYTAEHLVTIRGENLNLLAWAMKEQRVDDLRVATESEQREQEMGWAIYSITAEARGED